MVHGESSFLLQLHHVADFFSPVFGALRCTGIVSREIFLSLDQTHQWSWYWQAGGCGISYIYYYLPWNRESLFFILYASSNKLRPRPNRALTTHGVSCLLCCCNWMSIFWTRHLKQQRGWLLSAQPSEVVLSHFRLRGCFRPLKVWHLLHDI